MIDCRCPDCGARFKASPEGGHRLICGDSTDPEQIRHLIGGQAVDCVFTSPPYAVGVEYDGYEDTIDNLRNMLPILASFWADIVAPGGFAVVNFGDIVPAQALNSTNEPCEYPMAVEYWPVFRTAGWLLFTRRVWAKPHARVYSPWAIESCRAASDWEHLWVWKRPGKPIVGRGDLSAFGVWDSSRGEGVDVGKDDHGAGMPVVIARTALDTHSRPGSWIYEPFGGTGTTVIAAEATGRHCFAGELSPAYCDVIVERWSNYTGRQALLADGSTFDEVRAERLGVAA